MNIKQLSELLEQQITKKMDAFNKLGKESAELIRKNNEIKNKMADIFEELEPVEYLIRAQNPNFNALFDELKVIVDIKHKKIDKLPLHELSSQDRD